MGEKYSKAYCLNAIDALYNYMESDGTAVDISFSTDWDYKETNVGEYNFNYYYTYTCNHCNAVLSNGYYIFCPYCGAKLCSETNEERIINLLEEVKRLIKEK